MNLPPECWAHIQTFLKICRWPFKISNAIRQYVTFRERCRRAKPLHNLFTNVYRNCAVNGCTASRGAFRDLIVSPYCVQHACEWSCPRILYFKAP